MTLGRKISSMMEIGKKYTLDDLVKMLWAEHERIYDEVFSREDTPHGYRIKTPWVLAAESPLIGIRISEELMHAREAGYVTSELVGREVYYTRIAE